MPGVNITDLPPQTTPADTDVLPFDFNAATTPVTSKITIANLRIALRNAQFVSFCGEITGNNPVIVGSIYFSQSTTLAATARVLAGVVGAGTATVRLVEQATSAVVATWTTAAALGDVTLGAPTAALSAGWYTFDLAGSAAGTVTRCYGALLET